jgi:D-alanyl-D-alanine carboxypeptidase
MAHERWFVGLTMCLCLAGCGGHHATEPSGGHVDPAMARRLQRTLDQQRRLHRLPGAAAAVVIPGQGMWSGGSGIADRATGAPVRAQTPFAIASVTKLLVAALTVKLAAQGRLGLDDHLSRWLPRWPHADQITVRQLLNQTSGVAETRENDPAVHAVLTRPLSVWSIRRIQRTLRHADEPVSAPGVKWRYNNLNYLLAGLVIERATRATAAHELRQQLLDPLHLDDIVLQPQEQEPRAAAHAYGTLEGDTRTRDLSAGSRLRPFNSVGSALWTAAGIVASAPSLARLGDALLRGSLLAPASRAQLLTTVAGDGIMYASYGLGIGQNLSPRLSTMVWTVYGNLPGVASTLAFLPGPNVTAVVLANNDATEVTADIADRLLQAAAHPTSAE